MMAVVRTEVSKQVSYVFLGGSVHRLPSPAQITEENVSYTKAEIYIVNTR